MSSGFINFYYNEMPVEIDKIAKPCLELHYKVSGKKIISKEITEEIGREILNNSKVLMKGKNPFIPPITEDNSQSDNNGNNYSIDTKLLFMQSACHEIGKSGKVIINNINDYEYLFNFMISYEKYSKHLKSSTNIEMRQFEIIKKIEDTFNKYQKNLLFIFPIPQMDLVFDNSLDFNRNYLSGFFWSISKIRRKCNFKHDVYFAYPLFNNEYNLVKIGTTTYSCETFIKSKAQTKYLESSKIGMVIDNKFYPILAEIIRPKICFFHSRFKKNGK